MFRTIRVYTEIRRMEDDLCDMGAVVSISTSFRDEQSATDRNYQTCIFDHQTVGMAYCIYPMNS